MWRVCVMVCVCVCATGCAQSSYYTGGKATMYRGEGEQLTVLEATADYGGVVPYGDSERVKVLFALKGAMGYSLEQRGLWLKPLGVQVQYFIPVQSNYALVGLVIDPLLLEWSDTNSSDGVQDRIFTQSVSLGLSAGFFIPLIQGKGVGEQGGLEARITPHLMFREIPDQGDPYLGLGVEMGWRQLNARDETSRFP